MNIVTDNDDPLVLYGDLSGGDVFWYERKVYIKRSGNEGYSSIDLNSGEMLCIIDSTPVLKPKTVTVHLKF